MQQRNGFAVVICTFCLVLLITITALVVDLGYLHNARGEIQRTADASALAACWKLAEEFSNGSHSDDVITETISAARNVASINDVCKSAPGLADSDMEFGYLSDFDDPNATWDTSTPENFNAVRIRVRRTRSMNGQVSAFFARAFGVEGFDAAVTSTAVIVRDIKGFTIPNDGSNLDLLPFALDLETWQDMQLGNTSDNWSWNSNTETVEFGPDSILEVNLYPQNTGSPGNRGTVDIGGSNNSTNDIARQIVYGISSDDMDAMGGSLEFDEDGELILNGDTGISAGVKDELASIIGETRIIPIFSNVQGPGNNADFTIVQWAGVRILDVKLTGPKKQKRVIVQPAPISSPGIIPEAPNQGTSSFVFSRAFLIN